MVCGQERNINNSKRSHIQNVVYVKDELFVDKNPIIQKLSNTKDPLITRYIG